MTTTAKTWHLGNGLVEFGVLEIGGQLGPVRFVHNGGIIEPMHRAPWADEPGSANIPMMQHLRGDFFCAPFGANDLLQEELRDHGRTANGVWREVERTSMRLELELDGKVAGARVRKELWLEPGRPLIYQRHTFEGGEGALPLGHHAMLRAPAGEQLRISFSPWVWAGTPPAPVESDPENGSSLLRYPQRFESLNRVTTSNGTTVDLSRYPELDASEDILMLVTDPDEEVAWSAAVAPRSGWVWFAVRPNRILRNTLLWFSNGGRAYSPFLGRHRRVLGIEEVTSYFHLGHRTSVEPNDLNELGYPTAVTLDRNEATVINYAFGAVPTPPGFGRVASLQVEPSHILLRNDQGEELRVPFRGDFIRGSQ
ncbi:MAG: hypothetical protein WD273_15535 [Trueperaceae bacterium]